MVERRVFIYKRGWLKQKYYGVFKAYGNNETLAHTEFYVSKQSLLDMLLDYYPEWTVHDTTK